LFRSRIVLKGERKKEEGGGKKGRKEIGVKTLINET